MRLFKSLPFAFFLLNVFLLTAQNEQLDELKAKLETSKGDTVKVNNLLKLSEALYSTDPVIVIKYANDAKILADFLNYKLGEALALKYIGLSNYMQGNYLQVILSWEKALALFEEIDDKSGIANMLSNLGAVYNNQGNDAKALELYFKSLKLAEEINDTIRKITTLNNIGLIYSKKPASESLALQNYKQALALSEILRDNYAIGTASFNIGELYFSKKKIAEAQVHFNRALIAFRQDKSIHESDALNYLGKIYLLEKDYTTAITYQQQSYAIAVKLGGQLEMAKALLGMAETYNIAGDRENALKYNNEALNIATNLGAQYEKLTGLEGLAKLYAGESDFQKAYGYLNQVIVLKDTIYSEKNQEQLNNIRVKYEIEDMLKENEILKKDIEIREVRNNTQRTVIFFMILGFVVTSIQIGLLIKGNKQKRKANEILHDKNQLISNQQKEILDSIVYAKRIQQSALPQISEIAKHFSDIFVLFKPKDVVSGDFYWFAEVEKQLVITVADCTGHGVPGAFMSMLGMSMLKEIVQKEYMTQPDIVLRRLRKEVVKALGQTGQSGEQKDGMDMSLCSINMETLELQWAGANNPCLLVQDGIFRELKADKMPIAIYLKMDKYTMHHIQLKKGDIIYLITDGYHDQFGGPDNKKFMSKRLKALLLEISNRTMDEQHKILDIAITEWMKGHKMEYKQTDDITIMGLKI